MTPLARGTQTSKRGTSSASTISLATSSASTGLTQFLADAAGQLGVDDGRHHAGDLDAAAAQLRPHRLAEADHGVLGRRVGGDARQAPPCRPARRC